MDKLQTTDEYRAETEMNIRPISNEELNLLTLSGFSIPEGSNATLRQSIDRVRPKDFGTFDSYTKDDQAKGNEIRVSIQDTEDEGENQM